MPGPAATRRPDSEQLVRQWALLRLLADSQHGLGVKHLAEQLGVSKATIQRDLVTLERDFAVIEEAVGAQKKLYRIDHKIRALEAIQFGVTELLALYAAEAALSALSGTPLHADLRSVLHKLRGFLSDRHNGGLSAMASVYAPHLRDHVDLAAQHDAIDGLVDAIARKRVCELTYHAAWAGTTKTHKARPLRLVWHRSALYLFACLGTHERITTLAVHRVQALVVTGETFKPPAVDVDAHIDKAFGIFVSDEEQDVEVIFDAEIAWRIDERTFHPEEKKERLPDGRLRYSVRSSAQWEIVPWVQSFGALAELRAPAAWREALKATVEAMRARYA